MTLILGALIFWVSAWILNARLADSALAETRFVKLLVPSQTLTSGFFLEKTKRLGPTQGFIGLLNAMVPF